MVIRLKNTLAEFIGTLFYILIGCGSIIALKTDYKNGCAYLVVALAFSAAYAAAYYTLFRVSKAHFNPALSFSALILGDISFLDFIFYIIGQFSGAFAACGLLFAIFYGHTATFAANEVYDDSPWLSLLIVFLLCAFFILARISSEKNQKNLAGIVSAASLFAVNALGIQLTLGGVNPARAISSAVFAGGDYIKNVWPFVVGPFLAALVAVLIHFALNNKEDDNASCIIEEQTDKNTDEKSDIDNCNAINNR